MKDKQGNQLTTKEYMKRWKEGIKMITPLQKVENDLRATFIMTVGYLVGVISLLLFFDKFITKWFTIALIIIFFGALYGSVVKTIALFGQFKLLKNLDKNAIELQEVLNG